MVNNLRKSYKRNKSTRTKDKYIASKNFIQTATNATTWGISGYGLDKVSEYELLSHNFFLFQDYVLLQIRQLFQSSSLLVYKRSFSIPTDNRPAQFLGH